MFNSYDCFIRISKFEVCNFVMYISETLRKREEYEFKHGEDKPIEANT